MNDMKLRYPNLDEQIKDHQRLLDDKRTWCLYDTAVPCLISHIPSGKIIFYTEDEVPLAKLDIEGEERNRLEIVQRKDEIEDELEHYKEIQSSIEYDVQPTVASMSQLSINFFNIEIDRVNNLVSDIEIHSKIMKDYLDILYKSLDIQIDYGEELKKSSMMIQVSEVGKDNVESEAAGIVDTLKIIAKFLNSLGKKTKVVDTSKKEKNDEK